MISARARGWWNHRKADVAALSSIVIFFVCFFPHVLFGKRFIIAGDALYYSYPLRTVAWQMIRGGQLPLWTPYVLSGYPLLSMAQIAIGYPVTWVYLLIHGPWAEQIYVLTPFLLSPIFTYAYAREVGRSRLASLLAGLAFGYGGMMCGFISNSGMLTNSLMWAPLLLLLVERARTRSLAYALSRAAFIYTLSVLAGHGQSYVYVGLLAVWYGLFLSLWKCATERKILNWTSWRPLIVAVGALILSAGAASFQLFESLRAARRSVRSSLTFQIFSEGSFEPREALLSIGTQLYHYVDTGAYVAPLAIILAVVSVAYALHAHSHDVHITFFAFTALLAFLLMLGGNTPLYRLIFLVPVLNQFRVPSRHTFEWTFAISILAAYGWDLVMRKVDTKKSRDFALRDQLVGVGLIALLVALTAIWWKATSKPPVPNPSTYTGLPELSYWWLKLAFTLGVVALGWFSLRFEDSRLRSGMLAACIMLACFAEPAATVSCWWGRQLSLSDERLREVSPTTRFLQKLPADQNRIYTRVGLFNDEFRNKPRLEAPNLSAIHGLQNVAGMEPLILDRYSRALGGIGPDSVTPRPGFSSNVDLFGAQSHVLDILNNTHVVTFAGLKIFEDETVYRDGIGIAVPDLNINVAPGQSTELSGSKLLADQLALVTSLSNSVEEQQGTPIAHVRFTVDGQDKEVALRAGIDSAEWAHERPDVRATIKHSLAPIFDSRPGDPGNSFQSHRYWSVISLGTGQKISAIEVKNISQKASLAIWRASLFDSQTKASSALTRTALSSYWTTVFDEEQVQILLNSRALPRAWLVTEVESVDGEQALRKIRGEDSRPFDPSRTALLEVAQTELPELGFRGSTATNEARITNYEPNRIRIETNASGPTVLVVSELFYPGWEAAVDSQPTRILLTDFLLRGVALPTGHHTVEMTYKAPAAQIGAVISVLTFALLATLFFYSRRQEQFPE